MITKSFADTVLGELQQINRQLQKQAQEISKLRAEAAVQFRRIADMQAELDLLPVAKKRRQTFRALLQGSAPHNGDNGTGRAD